jgi:hypothetical protein
MCRIPRLLLTCGGHEAHRACWRHVPNASGKRQGHRGRRATPATVRGAMACGMGSPRWRWSREQRTASGCSPLGPLPTIPVNGTLLLSLTSMEREHSHFERGTEGEALARLALERPRHASGAAGMRFALAMGKPRRFPGCKAGECREGIQGAVCGITPRHKHSAREQHLCCVDMGRCWEGPSLCCVFSPAWRGPWR